jgi:hypothetical protein
MSSTQELGFDIEALLNKGKPRFEKRKYESLKQGTAFYHLLSSYNPANRSLDHKYHVHWLKYVNENGETVNVKAQCVKYIEGFCPICDAHRKADDALKHAVANGITGESLKRLQDAENALRASGTVYYNALNANNETVVLQLSSTVSKLLDKKIAEAYQDFGNDITSTNNGIWFQFKKDGIGRESVTVDFKRVRSSENGKITESIDQTPVAPELVEKLSGQVADIHNPDAVGIRLFTAKELANFLRGEALPDRRPKREQQAPVTAASEPVVPTETILEAVTRVEASTGRSVGATLLSDSPAAAATAPAPQTGASTAQAEIQRLRALSQRK